MVRRAERTWGAHLSLQRPNHLATGTPDGWLPSSGVDEAARNQPEETFGVLWKMLNDVSSGIQFLGLAGGVSQQVLEGPQGAEILKFARS